MNIRILIIKTAPNWFDGIHIVIQNIIQYINHEGITIDVVVPEQPISSFNELVTSYGGKVFVLKRSITHPLRYLKSLVKIITVGKYDVVHAHGNSHTLFLEMLAAKKGKCKIRIAHSHNTSCKHKLIHDALTPFFNSVCNYRMACGLDAGKWLFGSKSFEVFNNGINTDLFVFSSDNRLKIRKHYSIKDDDVLIGHVGKFTKIKNQSFIVELLPSLPNNYKLFLIGSGSLYDNVRAKTSELNLEERVFFLGDVSNVYEYLSAVDLILMPSLFEGLPLSLIEEQANGLFCIVSDNITSEADKTGNILPLPLSEIGVWKDQILSFTKNDREASSEQAIASLKNAGYDIVQECEKLKVFYIESVFKENKR